MRAGPEAPASRDRLGPAMLYFPRMPLSSREIDIPESPYETLLGITVAEYGWVAAKAAVRELRVTEKRLGVVSDPVVGGHRDASSHGDRPGAETVQMTRLGACS